MQQLSLPKYLCQSLGTMPFGGWGLLQGMQGLLSLLPTCIRISSGFRVVVLAMLIFGMESRVLIHREHQRCLQKMMAPKNLQVSVMEKQIIAGSATWIIITPWCNKPTTKASLPSTMVLPGMVQELTRLRMQHTLPQTG